MKVVVADVDLSAINASTSEMANMKPYLIGVYACACLSVQWCSSAPRNRRPPMLVEIRKVLQVGVKLTEACLLVFPSQGRGEFMLGPQSSNVFNDC